MEKEEKEEKNLNCRNMKWPKMGFGHLIIPILVFPDFFVSPICINIQEKTCEIQFHEFFLPLLVNAYRAGSSPNAHFGTRKKLC